MDPKKITGIMACDHNGVIAYKGELPWNCPDDLAFYTDAIIGQVIIMGRATYEAMDKKLLKKCFAIVFTLNSHNCPKPKAGDKVVFVSNLDEFLHLKDVPKDKAWYMTGGAMLAGFFLQHDLLDDFYLTYIEGEHPGDTFLDLDLITHHPRTLIKKGDGCAIYLYDVKRKSSPATAS